MIIFIIKICTYTLSFISTRDSMLTQTTITLWSFLVTSLTVINYCITIITFCYIKPELTITNTRTCWGINNKISCIVTFRTSTFIRTLHTSCDQFLAFSTKIVFQSVLGFTLAFTSIWSRIEISLIFTRCTILSITTFTTIK